MPQRIFITVGEVSGDNHAAGLVKSLKKLDPTIQIDAVGGPAMAAAGAVIHQETTKKAAMSFHAVKRVAEIRRLEQRLKARYASPETRPDLHICVDSSGFNLRFAKLAKAAGVPTLYYVAPQLWASREGRIKQVRANVDRLACIFPFEEKWFGDRGVAATFVGHPLFDELPVDRLARVPATRFPQRPLIIGVVAGSRRSEVRENFPPLIQVMQRIASVYPQATFLLPTTPAAQEIINEPRYADALKGLTVTVRQNAFDDLIPQCELVLCKSGTSTVHVAAYGIPMVVVYRISTLLWQAAGRWLIKTPKIAMVNILAGNIDLVPEFIPWNGDPSPVADSALAILASPDQLADMRKSLLDLIQPLDHRGASDNVARIAIDMLGRA
ncbi:MAG: lpxB [Phycisphaerales bacterium]|nr:lpxB [Phycisphaerales bacterium]